MLWRHTGEWRYWTTYTWTQHWMEVVSFTSRPLYVFLKSHWYAWSTKLNRPRTVWTVWKRDHLPLARNRTPVEAPWYKPEGRGFESQWSGFFFFNLPNSSSCTMALGSTQPLTEMSTRNLPGGVKGGRRVRLRTLPTSVSGLSRK
jgi:hypothetical protein